MLKVLLREARKIIIHSGSYKRSTKWIYAEALQRFVISEKFDTFDTIPNNHHRYPHILRSGWNTYKLKVSFLAVAVVLPDLSFNPLLNWISVKSGSIFDPTNHSDQIRKCVEGWGGSQWWVGLGVLGKGHQLSVVKFTRLTKNMWSWSWVACDGSCFTNFLSIEFQSKSILLSICI